MFDNVYDYKRYFDELQELFLKALMALRRKVFG